MRGLPKLIWGELRLSFFFLRWPSIRRELRNYDCVHLHGPAPTFSELFLVLLRLTMSAKSRPTVVYTHHFELDIPGARLLCWLYNEIHAWMMRLADGVVVTTRAYEQLLLDRGHRGSHRHPLGGGPPFLSGRRPPGGAIRRSHGWPDEDLQGPRSLAPSLPKSSRGPFTHRWRRSPPQTLRGARGSAGAAKRSFLRQRIRLRVVPAVCGIARGGAFFGIEDGSLRDGVARGYDDGLRAGGVQAAGCRRSGGRCRETRTARERGRARKGSPEPPAGPDSSGAPLRSSASTRSRVSMGGDGCEIPGPVRGALAGTIQPRDSS